MTHGHLLFKVLVDVFDWGGEEGGGGGGYSHLIHRLGSSIYCL